MTWNAFFSTPTVPGRHPQPFIRAITAADDHFWGMCTIRTLSQFTTCIFMSLSRPRGSGGFSSTRFGYPWCGNRMVKFWERLQIGIKELREDDIVANQHRQLAEMIQVYKDVGWQCTLDFRSRGHLSMYWLWLRQDRVYVPLRQYTVAQFVLKQAFVTLHVYTQ